MEQDAIFAEQEADQWFRRNAKVLNERLTQDDPIVSLVGLLGDISDLHSVADLGCSNGWRLQMLKDRHPHLDCKGFDPSAEAIADGAARFPAIELMTGMLSEVPFRREFDIVIVNGVLCWVGRNALARSLAEIDRVVKPGGYLIIGDFMPDFPHRRRYGHLEGDDVYTYKQDYSSVFKELGTYAEAARVSSNLLSRGLVIESAESDNRWGTVVLRKSNTFYTVAI
jgi:SAM-dependent methyltransferase